MATLSDLDRKRIETAVVDAEKRTSAEFVTVIADASGRYLYLPTLLAAAVTLLVSGLVLLLPVPLTFEQLYIGQVTAFIALSLLLRWPPIKMWIVPREVQRRAAHLLAHEQFLDLGLSSTSGRTGVMLFVSLAEHYVEIITDRGIQAKIDNAAWQKIIARFTAEVRGGELASGFVTAIAGCADVLAQQFPTSPDDVNELPNRLVEI
jgi:putative membrane protein